MEVAVVPGEDQDEDVRREVRQEIDWSVIVGSVIWGGCHHPVVARTDGFTTKPSSVCALSALSVCDMLKFFFLLPSGGLRPRPRATGRRA